MRKANIVIIIIILVSFIIALWAYPNVPDKMASHWNAKGQVDGYMSKFWGLFLMPIISFSLFLLFLVIPVIDPLKANIKKFRKYFDWFIILLFVFFFYIFMLTILWNLGVRYNMNIAMVPALGLLFFYIGILLQKAKRNWFIGIRTPWTLSSDQVWDKTHKLGANLFKIAGVVAIIGIFFPKYSIWFVLIPVLAFAFYLIVYSYFEYQKEKK
ncbi:hypothetical protein AYK26_01220 [Euryarchaeota archaeon SM23-78]|nr:MAG: hypothetical protein AYK26_01220 [Euryarchaeota archaeon SM23-78]MBW3000648.1 DUF1648 domain-containing protein [Candidatus Woesearchaeota archaeon]